MQAAHLGRRHWMLALLMAFSSHAVGMWWLFGDAQTELAPAGAGMGLQISLAAGSGGGSGGGQRPQPITQPQERVVESPQPETKPRPVERQPKPKHRHKHKPEKPHHRERKKPQPKPVDNQLQSKPTEPEPVTPVQERQAPEEVARHQEQPPSKTLTSEQKSDEAQSVVNADAVGGGADGQSQQTQTLAGDGRAQGAGSSAQSSYAGELLAWLERHKKYPRLARMQRTQGTALLTFRLDRQGQVLEYHLKQSSGSPLLDKAVLKMLQRAQPLPPIPAQIGGADLTVTLPIEFKLW